MPLNKCFSSDSIGLLEFFSRCRCIITLAFLYPFIAWKLDNRFRNIFISFYFITNSFYIIKRFNRKSLAQPLCNFYCLQFAHTVRKYVSLAVKQHRRHYIIHPIVIMSKPSERCFKTSYNYGTVGKKSADNTRIYSNSSVRTLAAFSACRIRIIMALSFCNGVVCNHTVNISCGYKKT